MNDHDKSRSVRSVYLVLAIALTIIASRPLIQQWNVDANGLNPDTHNLAVWDFGNIWSGGRLAAEGRTSVLFDRAGFSAWQRQTFSPDMEFHEWSYPPSVLLLAVPLSHLPLLVAYAVWTVGSLALLAWAVIGTGAGWAAAFIAIANPAVVSNMVLGQGGALTAAALIGAMTQLTRRPVVAGIIIGLLSLKPQFGVLLPVCLLATRSWRAIAVAAATVATLVLATGMLFGWDCWASFFSVTRPNMQGVLETPWLYGYQNTAVTLFMTVRALGAGIATSYLVQTASIAVCAAIVWIVWRREDVDLPTRTAVTVCLTFLATPYAWFYDMVAVNAVIALVVARSGWRFNSALMLIWILPMMSPALISILHVPLGPLVIASTAFICWREGSGHRRKTTHPV